MVKVFDDFIGEFATNSFFLRHLTLALHLPLDLQNCWFQLIIEFFYAFEIKVDLFLFLTHEFVQNPPVLWFQIMDVFSFL